MSDTCDKCGTGHFTFRVGPGRVLRRRKHRTLAIPQDLAVLTCDTEGCGAMLLDGEALNYIAYVNGYEAKREVEAEMTTKTYLERVFGPLPTLGQVGDLVVYTVVAMLGFACILIGCAALLFWLMH